MPKIKKISVSIIMLAIMASVSIMPAFAATSGSLLDSLGSLFVLSTLFKGSSSNGLLGNGQTSLGDLFILNQLFQGSNLLAAAPTTAAPAAVTPAVVTISLAQKLSGKILLQAKNQGQAWYVNPVNQKRYFLGSPSNAFSQMACSALGVSNSEFNSFGSKAPQRLAGKFLIKTQDAGKLYYVSPTDLSINYIANPTGALATIKKFGLGITDANIAKISTAAACMK